MSDTIDQRAGARSSKVDVAGRDIIWRAFHERGYIVTGMVRVASSQPGVREGWHISYAPRGGTIGARGQCHAELVHQIVEWAATLPQTVPDGPRRPKGQPKEARRG